MAALKTLGLCLATIQKGALSAQLLGKGVGWDREKDNPGFLSLCTVDTWGQIIFVVEDYLAIIRYLATFTFHFHALEKEMATHSSVLAWRIPGTGVTLVGCRYGVAQSRT